MENLTFRQTKEATFTTPVVKFTEGELEHEYGKKSKAVQIKGFARNGNFAVSIANGYAEALTVWGGISGKVVKDFRNNCVYIVGDEYSNLSISTVHKAVVTMA